MDTKLADWTFRLRLVIMSTKAMVCSDMTDGTRSLTYHLYNSSIMVLFSPPSTRRIPIAYRRTSLSARVLDWVLTCSSSLGVKRLEDLLTRGLAKSGTFL